MATTEPQESNGSKNGRRVRARAQEPNEARLDQVRELLFGEQARDTDERLVALESRLGKSLQGLRKQMFERLDAMQEENRARFTTLHEELEKETRERNETAQGITADLGERSSALADTIERLEASTKAAAESIEANLREASDRFESELQSKYDAAREALAETRRELLDRKADRETLAHLFSDIAAQLSGDGKKGQ